MESRRFTVEEARQRLRESVDAMDVDDLALALSEHGLFEDVVVVVTNRLVESYAYWNGYSSDKRGDVTAFQKEDADA